MWDMKINWSKALADYLKDETQSYASIASKHGVSLQAVKKRAGKDGWQDLRQKSIQKVNQRLPEITGEAVAMIDARQAQMGKTLQYLGLKAIVDKGLVPETFAQARESIKDGAKIEREAVDAGAEERERKEMANIFNIARERYTWHDKDEKPQQKIEPPVNQIKEASAVNLPPYFEEKLAEVQIRLEKITKELDSISS